MERAVARKKRALLVEDEPNISRVCDRTLSAEGFEVDIAISGKIALDALRQKRYELCLIDIRTPTMGGIELYRCSEKESPGPIGDVIFTTAEILNDDISVFLEQTGMPYLPKPFSPTELRAAVTKALV